MSLVSIEILGSLLSEYLLESLSIEDSKHKFAAPESFRWERYDVVDSKTMHLSRIAEAYENLKARWDLLSPEFEKIDLSELREKWLKHFFSQFGYNLQFQKADIVADSGNKFCLSHRGWGGLNAPIIHTVSFAQDLDHKPNDGRHRYSPHDTLQRYLNQSHTDNWGIVTNGKELRILRDFHHETRKAYVKLDLEAIFDGRNFFDFRLLWRLIHPSRFIPKDDNKPILEVLFEESKDAGIAIGDNLRRNIRFAIETFANGFLLGTPELAEKATDNHDACVDFHQQILRVIYRILFLLYVEQRRLMPGKSSIYAQEYSISALREKLESRQYYDAQCVDIWEGLKSTFLMVYKGVSELGISPFNGQLFDPDTIDMLCNAHSRNDRLMESIKYMSLFEKEGVMQRISYIELGVDEIGSIYESLLAFIPRVSSKEETFEDEDIIGRDKRRIVPPRTFFLDPRGTNRKTSGSYYTNPGLVNALIESALIPVLEEKLKLAGPHKDAQEQALLALKVCDPACGSAAFLIAATEYLGERLAKIRIQDDYPSDEEIRHARRDILRHCIYGVDLNPMAVELAKVSLWLTAATGDQPLNFLDHRIKCGDSLVGATPELIGKGISPEAYIAVEGDNATLAKERTKQVNVYYKTKDKEKGQIKLNVVSLAPDSKLIYCEDLSLKFNENSPDEIDKIEEAYTAYREESLFLRNKFIADYWTSAFFWHHLDEKEEYPRPEVLEYLLSNEKANLSGEIRTKIQNLALGHKFFHWHLEFPEVFAQGGFDCVLGNPPWEKIKLQEKEFFAFEADEISNAETASVRKRLIVALQVKNPRLYAQYVASLRNAECLSKFLRASGKFILSAQGDINTYMIFAELSKDIINHYGYVGIIVPSGIATDDTTKEYFQFIIDNNMLSSLYDFENSEGLFPEVHRSYKFSLLTLRGEKSGDGEALFSFFNTNINHLEDTERQFRLKKDDFKLINPNTRTCPIFRSKRDAEIIKKIYQNVPVLIDESKTPPENYWGVRFFTMFHMTNDAHLFYPREKLENEGYVLEGNILKRGNEVFLPLYEGKMIWIYNHRASSVAYHDGIVQGRHDTIESTPAQLADPNFCAMPRMWVAKEEVENRIDKKNKYFLGFRDVTNSSAERTAIFCLLPFAAAANNLPLCLLTEESLRPCFVANVSTLVFDYVTRVKTGGNHFNFFIVEQFPILSPDKYNNAELVSSIIKRVVELYFVSNAFSDFARAYGYTGQSFQWDEAKRLIIQAELDAIYAHLYHLTRDELDYILETFPLVKQAEITKYHEYRTKRLILEKYDEYKNRF